jgi:hypothetical protein
MAGTKDAGTQADLIGINNDIGMTAVKSGVAQTAFGAVAHARTKRGHGSSNFDFAYLEPHERITPGCWSGNSLNQGMLTSTSRNPISDTRSSAETSSRRLAPWRNTTPDHHISLPKPLSDGVATFPAARDLARDRKGF